MASAQSHMGMVNNFTELAGGILKWWCSDQAAIKFFKVKQKNLQ